MSSEMTTAGREFSEFFDRFFDLPRTTNGNGRSTVAGNAGGWLSAASVWEADDQFHVELDLPGVDEDAIEVTMEDGSLRVHARRHWDQEGRRYLHQERRDGEVTRLVKLPETIDPDSIDASYVRGVLHLAMRKRPEVMPRKIEVRTSTN